MLLFSLSLIGKAGWTSRPSSFPRQGTGLKFITSTLEINKAVTPKDQKKHIDLIADRSSTDPDGPEMSLGSLVLGQEDVDDLRSMETAAADEIRLWEELLFSQFFDSQVVSIGLLTDLDEVVLSKSGDKIQLSRGIIEVSVLGEVLAIKSQNVPKAHLLVLDMTVGVSHLFWYCSISQRRSFPTSKDLTPEQKL